jgi:hypothetical protein
MGSENSPPPKVDYGTAEKERMGFNIVMCMVISFVGWLLAQSILLGEKMSTTPPHQLDSWGITLMPTTCFLGFYAFLSLALLVMVRLCLREDLSKPDAKSQYYVKCCNKRINPGCYNWILFGSVAFFLPAFVFMVMFSLYSNGFFDWWVAVVTSISTCIVFVSIYLVFYPPNQCCGCTPELQDYSRKL